MSALPFLVVLAVLATVFTLISGPLRGARHDPTDVGVDVADLEVARDLKLQEIRDAELDLRTGKLTDDDFQAIDATLRTEAVEILRRLDDARTEELAGVGGDPDSPLGSAR